MSVAEIAALIGRSSTFVNGRLDARMVAKRTRSETALAYIRTHPSYAEKLYKWKVKDPGAVTEAKLLLMTMIITEGCIRRNEVHFTNTQEILHDMFRRAVRDAYGDVRVGRSNRNSRFSGKLLTDDIAPHIQGKVFSKACLSQILSSQALCAKVARIITDTEGSMIISAKKAPRNYTVESRIVLASTNPAFRLQIQAILMALGIESHMNRLGVHVMKKEHIKRFIESVGFTPGLRVIRKRAGLSVWYGHDKSVMAKAFLYISDRQDRAWGNPKRCLFADCTSREQTIERLMSIYRQVSGG
jgi:hypothetical protein